MKVHIEQMIVFFGGGGKLIYRLIRYEKQSAQMCKRIHGTKLQEHQRLLGNELLDTFNGHTVDEAKQHLMSQVPNKYCEIYVQLLCSFWNYDRDCPHH